MAEEPMVVWPMDCIDRDGHTTVEFESAEQGVVLVSCTTCGEDAVLKRRPPQDARRG